MFDNVPALQMFHLFPYKLILSNQSLHHHLLLYQIHQIQILLQLLKRCIQHTLIKHMLPKPT